MTVKIYSRAAIEQLLMEEFSDCRADQRTHTGEESEELKQESVSDVSAIISFYDPPTLRGTDQDYKPVDYSGKASRVFQIKLHDIDKDILGAFGFTYETYFPEADELAEFIYSAKNDGLDIICQCEYGQSRSAGCAAAIREHFYSDGIVVFADYRYYPNQLIYNKVLSALEDYRKRKTDNPFYYHASEEYIKERLEKAGCDDMLISSLSIISKESCFRAKDKIESFLYSKNLLCDLWDQAIEGFLGEDPFEYISAKIRVTNAQYGGPGAPMTLFGETRFLNERISIILWLNWVLRDWNKRDEMKAMSEQRRQKRAVTANEELSDVTNYRAPKKVHFERCGITEFELLGKMLWNREKKQIVLTPMIIYF